MISTTGSGTQVTRPEHCRRRRAPRQNHVVVFLAHTNDFIPKEKFVAAGASLQFIFGMGAMGGPFLCSIFMGMVGPNGFFIFLLFFHSLIGIYGIYRSRVRPVVENPDSQFVAMPQSITPAGIDLNSVTLIEKSRNTA